MSQQSVLINFLIGNNKMILCEMEKFLNMTESDKQRLIRKSFPRMVLGPKNLFGFKRKIRYRLNFVNKKCGKPFGHNTRRFINGNDWNETPSIALLLCKEHKTPYLAVFTGVS